MGLGKTRARTTKGTPFTNRRKLVGYGGDWRSSVDRPDLFETSAKVCCKRFKAEAVEAGDSFFS